MKIIVIFIIVITTYSCGIKPKVSCKVDDINNAIQKCIEQPEFGISKEF